MAEGAGWAMMRFVLTAVGACAFTTIPAQAQQRVESPPDPYVHRGTGFAFPAKVGPFKRESITEYDVDATDVGANYELIADGGTAAIVTVYVYPLPQDGGPDEAARCRNNFDGARQALVDRFAGAKVVQEDERPAPDPDAETQGNHVSYGITSDFFTPDGAAESGLYLYCPSGSGWQVKYRTSIPADGARDAAVQQFMRTLEWPEKLGG